MFWIIKKSSNIFQTVVGALFHDLYLLTDLKGDSIKKLLCLNFYKSYKSGY